MVWTSASDGKVKDDGRSRSVPCVWCFARPTPDFPYITETLLCNQLSAIRVTIIVGLVLNVRKGCVHRVILNGREKE